MEFLKFLESNRDFAVGLAVFTFLGAAGVVGATGLAYETWQEYRLKWYRLKHSIAEPKEENADE